VLVYAIIFTLFAFFTLMAQVTKRFRLATIANIGKGGLFLFLVFILLTRGGISYFSLILATIIACFILLTFLTLHFRNVLFYQETSHIAPLQYVKDNTTVGIFVLLGNFITLIIMSVDRMAVGSFFSITQFATYTFAVTICGLAMTFLQAVAQVFFPYLMGSDRETRTKAYHHLRPALLLFWAGVLVAYFPFSVWLRYYLPHYVDSLPLMAVLLCMIGVSSQIQILHVNFFKAYRIQRLYFTLAAISLACAIGLYFLATVLFGTLMSIAVTAVISSLLWYLLNEISLRRFVDTNNREITKWLLIIGIYAGAFLATFGLAQEWVYGMVIYLAIFMLVTSTILKPEVIGLLNLISTITNRNKDKMRVQTGR
jgi:O-antigen/teichoic acid export membrane protein